ncbi:unnamed protein product [Psylliodes chrysocephalus]|uniref:Rab proteins geranylgeranyltransferase component A n=1 Tax=Psylliodes chrysocephalus TaxID=3402493 RepID=A0A9P0CMR4_9CUCU|nr:unnamed protein product [Psylliodes chrysocephala]
MDFEFPKEFDVIIVGTGVIESILSAAASRVGKRVLHIDENEYYGGQWASFNLEAIMKLKNSQKERIANKSDSNFLSFGNDLFNIKNIDYKFHVLPKKNKVCSEEKDKEVVDNNLQEVSQDDNEETWDEELLIKTSRKFNIDLCPKLQYARGNFVELLISSNIARYSEYRSVTRILTWLNNHLEPLPCSRSDVFANTRVSVVEKRMLMKLLTSLNDEEKETQNYESKTFKEFLTDKKLTSNLVHYVLYGISTSSDHTQCKEGIQKAKRFLNSLGRFGKTPFLFSMYGSGEIPQAFCRLSAVFGGIFALGQPIEGFALNDEKFKSLTVRSQTIKAEHLVMGIENLPKQFIKSKKHDYISRCILITNKSVLDCEKEQLTLIFYPPENNKSFTTIIELGYLTGTCPNNVYLVHLIAKQDTSPQEDFKHIIDKLFINSYHEMAENNHDKPHILWSYYCSINDSNDVELTEDLPKNIFVCPGPDLDLDYDFSVTKAKKIFNAMYPDLEFLPRAPDPEEIIIGDDEITEEAKEITEEAKEITEEAKEITEEAKEITEEAKEITKEMTEEAKEITEEAEETTENEINDVKNEKQETISEERQHTVE